jgi:fatty acid desaturase
LFILGIATALIGWFFHPFIPYPLVLLAGLLCCFVAYLIYEPSDPIDEVINFLEQKMMLRYELFQ